MSFDMETHSPRTYRTFELATQAGLLSQLRGYTSLSLSLYPDDVVIFTNLKLSYIYASLSLSLSR
jgi:hypothetical protein